MDQNEIGWADPQQFLTKLVGELKNDQKVSKKTKKVSKKGKRVSKKDKKVSKIAKKTSK